MKTKNKLIFYLVEVYVFSERNFSWSIGQFSGSAITQTLQKSEELPLACLYLSFHWVLVIHTYFCTKGYDYVKRFVRVLVLSVLNTGCPKKIAKNWEHCIVDFQFKLC